MPEVILDLWNIQQSLGLVFLVLAFCYFIRSKLDWTFLASYFYFSMSGLFNGFSLNVLQMTMFVLFYCFAPEKWTKPLLTIIIGLFACDAVWLLFGHDYGILNAHSFDTAVMSCLLPILFKDKFMPLFKYVTGMALVSAILIKGGATGILCLLVFLIFTRRWLLCLPIILGACLKYNSLLDNNGRWPMWKSYMTFWDQNANHWFGFGFGSFEVIGTTLQVNGLLYRFIHNSYLQILFETGVIGLLCLIAMTIKVFDSKERLFFILLFICGMTYFPEHFFIVQLLIVLMLKRGEIND